MFLALGELVIGAYTDRSFGRNSYHAASITDNTPAI